MSVSISGGGGGSYIPPFERVVKENISIREYLPGTKDHLLLEVLNGQGVITSLTVPTNVFDLELIVDGVDQGVMALRPSTDSPLTYVFFNKSVKVAARDKGSGGSNTCVLQARVFA